MNRKKQTKYEGIFIDKLVGKFEDLHAERVAGSGRKKTSAGDVVIVKKSTPYLSEVKATKQKSYCFTRKRRKNLLEKSKRCGATPLLAVRFKRRRWVVVDLTSRDCWTVHHDDESLWELD